MTTETITTFAVLSMALLVAPQLAHAQEKGISLTSTTYIQASKQEVMDYLRYLERYPSWSPFLVADPEQKHHVTGVDGTVGATFHWEGVAEKSLGSQRIAELQGTDYVRMECEILKPFKGHSTFAYTLTASAGTIKVEQAFFLPSKGFSRFMIKLFGVEKHMAALNQLGMDRLKVAVETQALTGR